MTVSNSDTCKFH